MRTDQLIQAMEADTTRARPMGGTLAVVMLGVTLAVAAVFLPMVGPRPDLGPSMMSIPVMVKQAFPILIALGAFGAALRLARPGMRVGGWALALLAVPVLLGLAVAATMMRMPPADWMPAMMGQSNGQCLGYIVVMSIPLLAASIWALRSGASTRPSLSGAVAGLLSGGAAAIVYSLHCTEDSPLFYALWYILAILAVAGLGALMGSRWLRW